MTEQNTPTEGIIEHNSGTMYAGKDAVMMYAVTTAVHGLIFEYMSTSGMRVTSKGSPLKWLRQNGYTTKATKHGAIVEIIEHWRKVGAPGRYR